MEAGRAIMLTGEKSRRKGRQSSANELTASPRVLPLGFLSKQLRLEMARTSP